MNVYMCACIYCYKKGCRDSNLYVICVCARLVNGLVYILTIQINTKRVPQNLCCLGLAYIYKYIFIKLIRSNKDD